MLSMALRYSAKVHLSCLIPIRIDIASLSERKCGRASNKSNIVVIRLLRTVGTVPTGKTSELHSGRAQTSTRRRGFPERAERRQRPEASLQVPSLPAAPTASRDPATERGLMSLSQSAGPPAAQADRAKRPPNAHRPDQ